MKYRIVTQGRDRDHHDTNKRKACRFARVLAGDYETTASVYAGTSYNQEELIAQWRWTPENGGRVFRAQV